MTTVLVHGNLVLEDRIVEDGCLVLEDGIVRDVCPRIPGSADQVLDCRGHFVLPGFVDLHCDVIEKDVEIRRNVYIPDGLAVREADRRCAGSGITTQFHGVSFGHEERGLRDDERAAALARCIHGTAPELLVDNKVLLRCEIGSAGGAAKVAELLEEGAGDMVSFMDHSPQSGWYSLVLDAWRREGGADRIPGEGDAVLARMRKLMFQAAARGLPLGSHDDDSPERMEFLHDSGVGITEFPKTLEAAQAAVRLGLCTVVGAPNAVRGGSHLNWMSAADAVRNKVAGAICSDYHPTILPQAVFRLWQQGVASLPALVRLLTAVPARAAGLGDRGVLREGMRADVVEIACDSQGWARVIRTWSQGRLVAAFPDSVRIVGAHSRNPDQNITIAHA